MDLVVCNLNDFFFQSFFVYQEEAPAVELAGERLEPVTLDLGESKFDLTLFVAERSGSIERSGRSNAASPTRPSSPCVTEV